MAAGRQRHLLSRAAEVNRPHLKPTNEMNGERPEQVDIRVRVRLKYHRSAKGRKCSGPPRGRRPTTRQRARLRKLAKVEMPTIAQACVQLANILYGDSTRGPFSVALSLSFLIDNSNFELWTVLPPSSPLDPIPLIIETQFCEHHHLRRGQQRQATPSSGWRR